jgi:hypothetical protein
MLAALKQRESTVWAEYKDGFEVELRFTPRAKLRTITERSLVREWVEHQMRQAPDQKKYAEIVAKEVIVNWRGLTGDVLRQMVLLDDYPADVPFSVEDCAWLLTTAYNFDIWVQQVSTEIEYFAAARKAQA